MAQVTLQRLLGRGNEAALLRSALHSVYRIRIEDPAGQVLLGADDGAVGVKCAVLLDGDSLGCVVADSQAAAEAVAMLLSHLAAKENEQKKLGAEVLNLYREVNLIHRFSEELSTLVGVKAVTASSLEQVRRVFTSTGGVLLLINPASGALETAAESGTSFIDNTAIQTRSGLLGALAHQGSAEIVNDVSSDPRYSPEDSGVCSVMSAPLRVNEERRGAILVGAASPTNYTAADLKLLSTLALQVATAIENATLHERTLATERERHQALAQLVAGVAHEVNTPLGIINTASSIIQQELTSEDAVRLTQDPKVKALFDDLTDTVNLMQKNITRAHTLIESFKNLSISQIVDTKETLVLTDVVREILALFSIQARKAHLDVQLKNELHPDGQTWVGYRGHLSRILLNLLTNVQRYAYPANAGGKVEVKLQHSAGSGGEFVLSVRDWGAGISPENLPRIFEPFFTTGRGSGGTGLGLAMVYNLVTDALHGMIKAESTLGSGTTITLTFPRVVPD